MATVPPPPPGIRQPLGTRVAPTRHATWGGNPYPKETREMVLQIWQNGGGDNGWKTQEQYGARAMDNKELE